MNEQISVVGINEILKLVIRTGEEHATQCDVLAHNLGLTCRKIQLHIEELRRSGVVICSSNRGYYYPASIEELQVYVWKESRRARSILRTLRCAEEKLEDWNEQEERKSEA